MKLKTPMDEKTARFLASAKSRTTAEQLEAAIALYEQGVRSNAMQQPATPPPVTFEDIFYGAFGSTAQAQKEHRPLHAPAADGLFGMLQGAAAAKEQQPANEFEDMFFGAFRRRF